MTFSKDTISIRFGWLPLVAMLMALMLPWVAADAQDKTKGQAAKDKAANIDKQRGQAVKAEKVAKPAKGKVDDHLQAIWGGLLGLVAEGKLSHEDAVEAMTSLKKEVFGAGQKPTGDKPGGKDPAAHKPGQKPTGVKPPVKKPAAEKGAQGGSKVKQAAIDAYFSQVWAKLQAAVKAGKLTEKEAAAKMAAIKQEKLGGR